MSTATRTTDAPVPSSRATATYGVTASPTSDAGRQPSPTSGLTHRRLWMTAGWLLIGYVVLTFVGIAFQQTLMLGDKPSNAAAVLLHSSMTKIFTGGYIEYLATLVYLVGALLIARLLRREGVAGEWLSSCIAGSALVGVAITIAVGFSAGAAAVYGGHHGASLATVTTVNDIRNFSFFLTGGLAGMFALAVSAAARLTGALPRWVSYGGTLVGVLYFATIPAARTGFMNYATLVGFVWMVGLGLAALRQSRRSVSETVPQAAAG
jgi:hypothetical protein